MIKIRVAAEMDIKETYDWYEEKRPGLGIDFISEIESTFKNIERQPALYPKVFKNIHKTFCKRFPYSIYYFKAKSNIIVIGVLHQKRSPMI